MMKSGFTIGFSAGLTERMFDEVASILGDASLPQGWERS